MIFYNVLNKATGRTEVLTKVAKEILERVKDFDKKYEIKGECDQHGREFNYSNFLNQANGKTITIGTESGTGSAEEEQEKNSGTGTENSGSEKSGTNDSGSNEGGKSAGPKGNNKRKDK